MKNIDREAVLAQLREVAPRAVHVGSICARLDARDERDRVRDLLDELKGLGLAQELPGNRYRLRKNAPPRGSDVQVVPTELRLVRGTLTLHPRGFGFVACEDGGDDVFLPAPEIGAALHGDRVEVVAKPSPKGWEGQLKNVLGRREKRFTARLFGRPGRRWLEPDDPRLRSPIEVVGKLPGTKRDRPKVEEGQLSVIAEFERYPQSNDDMPSARVVEVLGIEGITRVEVAKIKIREGVVEEFNEATVAEAQAFGDRVPTSEKGAPREDLRKLDLVTIDPPDARDHDDAIFVERKGKGYRVVVAIADVSHYVQENTELDKTALERGCSIYLPDRAIPMLPRELSTHLASLVPNKDRLCMGVEAELGPSGAVKHYRVFEGVMRSGGKLTYEGVARALGLTEEGPKQPAAQKRLPMLEALLELSRTLRKRRLKRGALDFDLPEAKVILDEANVEPIDVRRSKKDPGHRIAYQMVEEMMLLANELVAREMKTRGVPAIYRQHGKPDNAKLELFARLAGAFGHDIDSERASDPRELSRFLQSIEDKDEAPMLRYLLLRAMQQAVYGTDGTVGHFGLGTQDYLHFTSPIRRYPDLLVHRVLRRVLRGEPMDAVTLMPRLARAAAESSRLERRAVQVERDVKSLYRCILMRDRVGEEFEGTIASVDHYGFYVSLDEPFVDIHVPVSALVDDYYEMSDLGIRLIGTRTGRTFSMGDRIEVKILNVSLEKREIEGIPLEFGALLEEREGGERAPRRHRRDEGGAPRDGQGRDEKGRGEREQRRRDKEERRAQSRGRSESKRGGSSEGGAPAGGPRGRSRSKSGQGSGAAKGGEGIKTSHRGLPGRSSSQPSKGGATKRRAGRKRR